MYKFQFPNASKYATDQLGTENSDARLMLQLDYVEAEIRECRAEIIKGHTRNIPIEALDVIHAMETFLRLYDENYRSDFDADHKTVIKKNKDRGYYEAGTDYGDYIEEGR